MTNACDVVVPQSPSYRHAPNISYIEIDALWYWPRWLKKCTQIDGCWLWSGTTRNGYPFSKVRGSQCRSLHRMAWMTIFGPIPEDKELDHLCRRKNCINPFHLEAVTGRENVLRSHARQRVCHACTIQYWRDLRRSRRENVGSNSGG